MKISVEKAAQERSGIIAIVNLVRGKCTIPVLPVLIFLLLTALGAQQSTQILNSFSIFSTADEKRLVSNQSIAINNNK
ncbi:MAG: hypothetical protein GY874_22200 [Desulfobacteraceae bacterium]|nr:hypothetical protein [Desulfobacteraceae bacterium]